MTKTYDAILECSHDAGDLVSLLDALDNLECANTSPSIRGALVRAALDRARALNGRLEHLEVSTARAA